MKIFFWDFQDDNDIARQWFMFVINSIVLLFTGFALFGTWRHYKKCMFEMMPLSINFFATFILLNLKLFEKGYQFQYIGHLIEIFTYFLFCYTFAIIYTLISKPEQRRRVQMIWNIIMSVMIVLLLVMSILVFTGTISKKCKKETEQIPAIIGLIFEFLSFVPTVFYGTKILRQMVKKQQDGGEQENISTFTSEIYIRQRKKQIAIVLVTYFISLVLRIIVTMVTVFMWDFVFECNIIDGVFIITSEQFVGQFILVLAAINELVPHVAIPITMYVVPLRKIKRTKSIKLHQGLLDDDDDYDSNTSQQDQLQNRVSTLLTSRISQDSSPVKKSLKDIEQN